MKTAALYRFYLQMKVLKFKPNKEFFKSLKIHFIFVCK